VSGTERRPSTDRSIPIDDAASGSLAADDRNPLSLYDFDPFRSFAESIALIVQRVPISDRTRGSLERALATIDARDRRALLEKHRSQLAAFDRLGPLKYAELPFWAHLHALIAQWLDLDKGPPIDILDIGMGSGSFAMVAQSMGHRVTGTDVADDWYGELCRLAGAERIVAPVSAGEPYTPVDRRFDLITMMLPAFHRKREHGKRVYWSVEDWRLFLLGLVKDLLKPDGRIFILMPLNKDDDGNLSYSPLIGWAKARGARLDRTFSDGPIRHILFDGVTKAAFAADAVS